MFSKIDKKKSGYGFQPFGIEPLLDCVAAASASAAFAASAAASAFCCSNRTRYSFWYSSRDCCFDFPPPDDVC